MPVNGDFAAADGFFGGVQTISVSASPITLTSPAGFTATPSGGPTQAQNAVLKITGTLSANVKITLPLPGYYIIDNSAAVGNFVITFAAASAGQVVGMPYGSVKHIYNDGTNVKFVNLQEVGTYLDYAGSVVPGWIAACTVPPFLNCDGSTFSGVTYPVLAAILGGTTLPDSRGRARYTLGQGTGRLTSGGAGIDGTTLLASGGNNGIAASQIPAITSAGSNVITVNGSNIPVSASGAFALFVSIPSAGGPPSLPFSNSVWSFVNSLSGTNIINVTSNNTAGIGAIMPNAAPGLVGGITMIRAA